MSNEQTNQPNITSTHPALIDHLPADALEQIHWLPGNEACEGLLKVNYLGEDNVPTPEQFPVALAWRDVVFRVQPTRCLVISVEITSATNPEWSQEEEMALNSELMALSGEGIQCFWAKDPKSQDEFHFFAETTLLANEVTSDAVLQRLAHLREFIESILYGFEVLLNSL